jgi:hypothetical protein
MVDLVVDMPAERPMRRRLEVELIVDRTVVMHPTVRCVTVWRSI